MLKKQLLNQAITEAILSGDEYFAVKVDIGMVDYQIIINTMKSIIGGKADYYENAYTDDLELKANNNIKIIGFTHGNSYEEIQESIKYKDIRIR